MAGRGPAPKDASRRARTNADPVPQTILRADRCPAPALPAGYRSAAVRRWWSTWVTSPQAEHFTSTDWQFLLDTLPVVAAFYRGDLKQAAELRLRVAKFGATPEDRARLRMQFAQADEAEGRRPEPASPARERYQGLSVVGGAGAVAGA